MVNRHVIAERAKRSKHSIVEICLALILSSDCPLIDRIFSRQAVTMTIVVSAPDGTAALSQSTVASSSAMSSLAPPAEPANSRPLDSANAFVDYFLQMDSVSPQMVETFKATQSEYCIHRPTIVSYYSLKGSQRCLVFRRAITRTWPSRPTLLSTYLSSAL